MEDGEACAPEACPSVLDACNGHAAEAVPSAQLDRFDAPHVSPLLAPPDDGALMEAVKVSVGAMSVHDAGVSEASPMMLDRNVRSRSCAGSCTGALDQQEREHSSSASGDVVVSFPDAFVASAEPAASAPTEAMHAAHDGRDSAAGRSTRHSGEGCGAQASCRPYVGAAPHVAAARS